jgi:two-component system, NarL family, nitrate/nitrite response regulator NarL
MSRIFVVDDHPIVLSGLQSVLRGSDFEIAGVASDARSALAAISAAAPDLLILDVTLPDRSGLEVLASLRASGEDLPVVLLTAHLSDPDLRRAVELGAQGIVLKEGAPARLIDALRAVLRGERWIEPALLPRILDLRSAAGRGGLAALSGREQAVAGLVAQGMRNRDIAARLGITEGTVKVHLHRIYEKLGVGNRTELALLAREAEAR